VSAPSETRGRWIVATPPLTIERRGDEVGGPTGRHVRTPDGAVHDEAAWDGQRVVVCAPLLDQWRELRVTADAVTCERCLALRRGPGGWGREGR